MTPPIPQLAPEKIFLARWTYEQLASIRDQTLGPALRMPEYCFAIYDVLLAPMNEIIGPHREQDAGTVISVPTPWHAALILDSLQHHLCLQKRRVVFRGQADSNWGITSSLTRHGVDVTAEKFKAALFCDILKTMSFNHVTSMSPRFGTLQLSIPDDCYIAAAQHCGIKTNLVDFTPDPTVAVYFAASDLAPKPDQLASVYVLSLDSAIDRGCNVIVPPPFVERLHLQRGFFISRNDTLPVVDKLKDVLFEIQFPAAYEFSPFNVVRRGKAVIDLLVQNPAIDAVIADVMEIAKNEGVLEIGSDRYRGVVNNSAARNKRQFLQYYSDPILMWANYLDAFEDMLYWTAYYADETSLSIDHDTMQNIVKSNRDLISSVLQLYAWMKDDSTFALTDQRKEFVSNLSRLMVSMQ